MTAVCSSEDGPPQVHDSRSGFPVEDHEVTGGQEAFITILEPDNLPPKLVGRTANAADDRIETRTIAPACQNAYLRSLHKFKAPDFS